MGKWCRHSPVLYPSGGGLDYALPLSYRVLNGKGGTSASGQYSEVAGSTGGHWVVDIDWAEIDGRAECVGLSLRSFVPAGDDFVGPAVVDDEVRPVRSTVSRALPMSLIEEARAAERAAWRDPFDDEASRRSSTPSN